MSLLDRFFPSHEAEEELARHELRELLSWASADYHAKFMSYLEYNASANIPIGDNVTMVRGIERANTFREILTKLRRDVARARAALSQETE